MKKRIVVLLLVAIVILVIEVVIGIIIVNNENSVSSTGFNHEKWNEWMKNVVMPANEHNRMFAPYIDNTVKGKNLKDLIVKIANYNQTADNDYIVDIIYKSNNNVTDENAIVLVDANGIADVQEKMSIIVANKMYEVTGEMTRTGIYTKIIVTLEN